MYDKKDLEERKDELLNYLIRASENTSIYYCVAYDENEKKYWPSFKLYAKTGVIFYTEKSRMLDIIKLKISYWDPTRDISLIEEICQNNNFIMCESHHEEGFCFTITLKK